MSYSERSTSPDPLARSQPVAARTRNNIGRRSNRSAAAISQNVSSPSKSFVMDAGNMGDGGSPWRIKVTVEAEPSTGGSPTRRVTRTTKVPLKTGSSSPVKKSMISAVDSEAEIKRPQRKRGGTPIRRAARRSRTEESLEVKDVRSAAPREIEMSEQLQVELSSSSKKPKPRSQAALRPSRRSVRHNIKDRSSQMPSSDPASESEHGGAVFRSEAGEMTMANEDFTMISVETLESMKHDTSRLDISSVDRSVASVSYMPSSPPAAGDQATARDASKVAYPSIESLADHARNGDQPDAGTGNEDRNPYLKEGNIQQATSNQRPRPINSEPAEWRAERRAVSRRIEEANKSQVIVVEDVQLGAEDDRTASENEQPPDEGAGDELDIWAEEASRSLDEDTDQQGDSNVPSQPPHLQDLFSDQQAHPPRSKIPRTWRRTSGMDFSYADSPAHGVVETRKVSASTTDGEGGGVLTPPESSEDDEQLHDDEHAEDGDSSSSQPDAAATELHPEPGGDNEQQTRPDVISPHSDSGSNVTSPDNDDTGLFWQSNLPNLYKRPERPKLAQRQKAMDLSELLNLHGSQQSGDQSTDHANSSEMVDNTATSRFVGSSRAASRRAARANAQPAKVVPSPLRKSLLRSSKIGGELPTAQAAARTSFMPVSNSAVHSSHNGSVRSHVVGQPSSRSEVQAQVSSATSSRIQQHGKAWPTKERSYRPENTQAESDVVDENEASMISGLQGYYGTQTEESMETSRSYQEHLNLESPQKIKVNFNDSLSGISVLTPKKQCIPLFDDHSIISHRKIISPQSVTLVGKKGPTSVEAQAQQGIFSRLSETFWSAVVRPQGPTYVEPQPEPEYSTTLRKDIRSRYGVHSDQHPWTFAHMRTLHRMLNSRASKSDTLVPKSGPLPHALGRLVGKELQSMTSFRWTFTEQHAHVVMAFMQTLVAPHVVEAIEKGEVDFLGDSMAEEFRGGLGGRQGDEPLIWQPSGIGAPRGPIERDFVVKALGNCVWANIEARGKLAIMAEKEKWSDHKRKTIEMAVGKLDLSIALDA